jgi:hypothetical protein
MFSTARKYMEGHRLELFFMRLWIKLCWILPVVLELFLRRFLPSQYLAQSGGRTVLLAIGFLFNRFLLSSAHCGYFSACYRVACRTAPPSLLRGFFAAYRHPIQAMKWQLKWDVFRLLGFLICGLPGGFLLILGARETSYLSQIWIGGCGACLLLIGSLYFWVLLQRVQLFRYQQYRYKSFLYAIYDMFVRTRSQVNVLLKPAVFCTLLFPISFLFRTKSHVFRAIFLHRLPPFKKKVTVYRKIQNRALKKT